MDTVPIANRLHIGIFGKRNVGKSSLINALAGQDVSIVSDIAGTTTDPVGRAMELRGIGPVYIYDTPGYDDEGSLGNERVRRMRYVMKKIDLALLVTTFDGFDARDEELLGQLLEDRAKVLVVFNKSDLASGSGQPPGIITERNVPWVALSCRTGENVELAHRKIVETASGIRVEDDTLLGDMISSGDVVLLVVPIDLGAPKGRLILPQVRTIRDILDSHAVAVVAKERELAQALRTLKSNPRLVVCDSQVVLQVAREVPDDVALTTFSIMFSRLKGELEEFVRGASVIERLEDGDKVLICEACTHHPTPDDIGRVKLPRWIREYTGKDLHFDVNAGPLLDRWLSEYRLIVHCGGCMINRKEMLHRIAEARNSGTPITNYGIAISHVHGVLDRVLSPFPLEREILKTGLGDR
jgi:[FeFe] hydrogenase H-cluster maturation GTPase HydF